jgi:acetyl esterase/lipase
MSTLLLTQCDLFEQGKLSQPGFTTVSDVQYCTGGGKSLLMDIFIPSLQSKTPIPAILWLHGGGWERGDKNGNSGAVMLADSGFVTASIFYRLSGDAPFPADVEDSKCAIRYLRANAARYRIDPDHIGVAGVSAGGHLAALVATADKNAGLEGKGGGQTSQAECRLPQRITECPISVSARPSFNITRAKWS